MNWKLFTIVCVSVSLAAVPQNMIGCGPDADPYDYYAHFFSEDQWDDTRQYRPFYYTTNSFLYESFEPDNVPEKIIDEWVAYTGNEVTKEDASAFVYGDQLNNMTALYYEIERKKPAQYDSAFSTNRMTGYFKKNKDLEGLGYLIYAKRVEPYVTGSAYDWEAYNRDSIKMAALLKNGLQLHKAAKKDFYKLKYAYQVVRLAHYNDQYNDAIKLYDSIVAPNKYPSILQQLSISLKAGAMYRNGNPKEAAYIFSRMLSETLAKQESNYLSFSWCINHEIPKEEYLAYCKNNTERADMLALFGFLTSGDATALIHEIYQLAPSSKALEVLVVREINKIEEKFYSPILAKQKGGYNFFYYWEDDESVEALKNKEKDIIAFTDFLTKLAEDSKVNNRGLYATGAAYLAMIMHDYKRANKLIDFAASFKLNDKLKDQWSFTKLMITINESPTIDAAFEQKIVPSLEWALKKTLDEKNNYSNYYNTSGKWTLLYRNLLSVIMAKKYVAQGNGVKEILMVGAADFVQGYRSGVSYMHDHADANETHRLYELYTQQKPSTFDQFFIKNNTIQLNDIVDFAGTAYLREHDFKNAVEWLKKVPDNTGKINKDPFKDLLYDQENALPNEKVSTTKLAFAEEMLRLQNLSSKKSKQQAAYMYKMALGFYNTTYYGYAWELVQYYRSGSDGYFIPEDADYFKREYYGAFAAHDHFKKALNLSGDKEFKARCLFMMAKCSQKQLQQPQYNWRGDYDHYNVAMKNYTVTFEMNTYFPEFISTYGKTRFYQEAYNSCSYLRDFVKKQAK